MNLYKITFSHHAPKDSEQGIKCLLLAENDEQVYEWIASEPKPNDRSMFNGWKDNEGYTYNKEAEIFEDKDGDEVDSSWYDEEGNAENFKARMLRLKGEINDDDYYFTDAYYGITLFGWELLKEDVKTDYSELKELGIVYAVA